MSESNDIPLSVREIVFPPIFIVPEETNKSSHGFAALPKLLVPLPSGIKFEFIEVGDILPNAPVSLSSATTPLKVSIFASNVFVTAVVTYPAA